MNYTQQDYEKDKEILDNAPEGATHVSSGGVYFHPEDYEWSGIPACQDLNDIRQKVELYERLQNAADEIATFKAEFRELDEFKEIIEGGKKND